MLGIVFLIVLYDDCLCVYLLCCIEMCDGVLGVNCELVDVCVV